MGSMMKRWAVKRRPLCTEGHSCAPFDSKDHSVESAAFSLKPHSVESVALGKFTVRYSMCQGALSL